MSLSAESRVLLHGVRWETYERLLEDLGDGGPRLTYDDGALEIMSPSHAHERLKRRLARAIDALTMRLGIPMEGGGSMNFRNNARKVGFEPDECWWIQNHSLLRGVREYDPGVHPPPDLVLEVEVSRSALNKLRPFATIGVGEVWRYDGERIAVHVLGANGRYAEQPASRCFPWLPIDAFAARIAAGFDSDETTWIRAFTEWVRTVAPAPGAQ